MFGIDYVSLVIGFCCGLVVMAVISDRCNKEEVKELQKKHAEDRLGYLRIVEALEWQLDALKERLNWANEKLKKT